MNTFGENASVNHTQDEQISEKQRSSTMSAALLDVNQGEIEPSSDNVFEKQHSATPYALHPENQNAVAKKASNQRLQAPYAQPVLDGSKLPNERKPSKQRAERTSVDEKLMIVQERRKNQQAQQEKSLKEKLRKSENNILKWEESKKDKMQQHAANKGKEDQRRKEIEARREMLMEETMKRAKAQVARTDHQATVVMREKRNRSVDRGKRWSWGAGYGQSGVAFSTLNPIISGGRPTGTVGAVPWATHVRTAPSPFHFIDPTLKVFNIGNTIKTQFLISEFTTLILIMSF